jgi:hypothetical protein
MEEYLSTSALAKLAGVSREAVVKDINQGALPAEKRPDSHGSRWGGCWFVRATDAQKYIDTRKGGPRSSISACELERRTGKKHSIILDAIKGGELPAFRQVNKARFPWHILEEDAIAFCQRMGWEYVVNGKVQSNGHKQQPPPRESIKPVDTHQCSACGTIRGNILGDIDKTTKEKYGLLCMKCYQLVRDFEREPTRLRNVFDYLARTRLVPVSSMK